MIVNGYVDIFMPIFLDIMVARDSQNVTIKI